MKNIREKIISSYFSPHTALDVVDMYNWLDQNITINHPALLFFPKTLKTNPI